MRGRPARPPACPPAGPPDPSTCLHACYGTVQHSKRPTGAAAQGAGGASCQLCQLSARQGPGSGLGVSPHPDCTWPFPTLTTHVPPHPPWAAARRYRFGPQPSELGGQRALDFILDNQTLDATNRTLLIDIKLLSVRTGGT